MSADFLERIELIEECYEFMLAYAAQGLPDDGGSQAAGNCAVSSLAASRRLAG